MSADVLRRAVTALKRDNAAKRESALKTISVRLSSSIKNLNTLVNACDLVPVLSDTLDRHLTAVLARRLRLDDDGTNYPDGPPRPLSTPLSPMEQEMVLSLLYFIASARPSMDVRQAVEVFTAHAGLVRFALFTFARAPDLAMKQQTMLFVSVFTEVVMPQAQWAHWRDLAAEDFALRGVLACMAAELDLCLGNSRFLLAPLLMQWPAVQGHAWGPLLEACKDVADRLPRPDEYDVTKEPQRHRLVLRPGSSAEAARERRVEWLRKAFAGAYDKVRRHYATPEDVVVLHQGLHLCSGLLVAFMNAAKAARGQPPPPRGEVTAVDVRREFLRMTLRLACHAAAQESLPPEMKGGAPGRGLAHVLVLCLGSCLEGDAATEAVAMVRQTPGAVRGVVAIWRMLDPRAPQDMYAIGSGHEIVLRLLYGTYQLEEAERVDAARKAAQGVQGPAPADAESAEERVCREAREVPFLDVMCAILRDCASAMRELGPHVSPEAKACDCSTTHWHALASAACMSTTAVGQRAEEQYKLYRNAATLVLLHIARLRWWPGGRELLSEMLGPAPCRLASAASLTDLVPAAAVVELVASLAPSLDCSLVTQDPLDDPAAYDGATDAVDYYDGTAWLEAVLGKGVAPGKAGSRADELGAGDNKLMRAVVAHLLVSSRGDGVRRRQLEPEQPRGLNGMDHLLWRLLVPVIRREAGVERRPDDKVRDVRRKMMERLVTAGAVSATAAAMFVAPAAEEATGVVVAPSDGAGAAPGAREEHDDVTGSPASEPAASEEGHPRRDDEGGAGAPAAPAAPVTGSPASEAAASEEDSTVVLGSPPPRQPVDPGVGLLRQIKAAKDLLRFATAVASDLRIDVNGPTHAQLRDMVARAGAAVQQHLETPGTSPPPDPVVLTEWLRSLEAAWQTFERARLQWEPAPAACESCDCGAPVAAAAGGGGAGSKPRPRQCRNCNATTGRLMPCGGCRDTYYCNNQTCQAAHWPSHKVPCIVAQVRCGKRPAADLPRLLASTAKQGSRKDVETLLDCDLLLAEGNPPLEEQLGAAMLAAAAAGNAGNVGVLWDRGAARSGSAGDAFVAAAGAGHADVVGLMIEKGVGRSHLGEAFVAAVKNGCDAVMDVLKAEVSRPVAQKTPGPGNDGSK